MLLQASLTLHSSVYIKCAQLNDNLLDRYEELDGVRELRALETLYLERNPLALALGADARLAIAALSSASTAQPEAAAAAKRSIEEAIARGAQARPDYRRKVELALPTLLELDSSPTRHALESAHK